MHEFAITAQLLEQVERAAQQQGASHVLAVNVIAGERAGIVLDSMQFYFDELARGTVAQGAQLAVEYTPLRFHCESCAQDYIPRGEHFECPRCKMVGQLADDGTALVIQSIQVET